MGCGVEWAESVWLVSGWIGLAQIRSIFPIYTPPLSHIHAHTHTCMW